MKKNIAILLLAAMSAAFSTAAYAQDEVISAGEAAEIEVLQESAAEQGEVITEAVTEEQTEEATEATTEAAAEATTEATTEAVTDASADKQAEHKSHSGKSEVKHSRAYRLLAKSAKIEALAQVKQLRTENKAAKSEDKDKGAAKKAKAAEYNALTQQLKGYTVDDMVKDGDAYVSVDVLADALKADVSIEGDIAVITKDGETITAPISEINGKAVVAAADIIG